VIGDGQGPTVLITGAIHGDEYAGPMVINELIRSLEPAQMKGRLILVPAANAPALRAASRVSPLVGKNLARVLARLGVVPGALPDKPPASRRVRIPPRRSRLVSPGDGYFEPRRALGDTVQEGDVVDYPHVLTEPGLAPCELRFAANSTVYSQRTVGITRQSNSLGVLVEDEAEMAE
jgi:predicted deacylase